MKKLKNWVKIVILLAIVLAVLYFYGEDINEKIAGVFFSDDCLDQEDPGMVNQCYVSKAIYAKDVTLCRDGKITNAKAISYCEQEVAVNLSDPEICKEIEDELWKSTCFKKTGIALGDYELCSKSFFEDDRKECFFDVALSTNDTKPCIFIEDELRRAFCIESIAVQTWNVDICELEKKPHHRAQCYTSVAVATNNPAICEKSEEIDPVFKEHCLSKFSSE